MLLPQDSWGPCEWPLSADPAVLAEGLGRPCSASLLSLWGCGGAARPWLEGEDLGLSHSAVRAPICSWKNGICVSFIIKMLAATVY